MTKLTGLTSDIWFKLKNMQPIDLTVTFSGTGAGSAVLLGKQILVELAAAETAKYVNITTPMGFKVVNAYSVHKNATGCSWQIANTTDAITGTVTVAASDTDIDRPAVIDDAYNTFNIGDNDLRLIIGTAAFTGLIAIDIEPLHA